MSRSIIISSILHGLLIMITAMSLPFLAKKPIDLPPIVSIELIQSLCLKIKFLKRF